MKTRVPVLQEDSTPDFKKIFVLQTLLGAARTGTGVEVNSALLYLPVGGKVFYFNGENALFQYAVSACGPLRRKIFRRKDE